MPESIRTITPAEYPAWVGVMNAVFFRAGSSADGPAPSQPAIDLDRAWAAVDGNRFVGSLRSFPSDLTVPGDRQLPVAAVTNVAVLPTHRRRGLLRGMISRDLGASRERGEVASILITSEFPIYGRFGYGPATEHATWTIDPARSTIERRPAGSVEFVDRETARQMLPKVYDEVRRRRPGEILRGDAHWDADLGIDARAGSPAWKGWVVVHRDPDGTADGYARYHVHPAWEDRLERPSLIVDELTGRRPGVEADLWRFTLGVDMISSVSAGNRSPFDLLPWFLADHRAARITQRDDFLWLRPLDVPALLRGRAYDREARVVLEVVDELGLAGGRFEIDAGPGGADCRPTTAAAGLTVPVGALGSVALGGVALRTLADAGHVDVHDPVALDTADALLRWPVAPFCSTPF